MTQTPTPSPSVDLPSPAVRTAGKVQGTPVPPRPRFTLAPNWLQLSLIIAILGAAIFVALFERYLWASLLAIAGICFGASYFLRRMVGDDYDRT